MTVNQAEIEEIRRDCDAST